MTSGFDCDATDRAAAGHQTGLTHALGEARSASHRGVPGGRPPGRYPRVATGRWHQPSNKGGPRAVEVGFEPTHPRIFPDFVLEYAGWGEIPKLGISCGHANGRDPSCVKRLRRRGRRSRRSGRTVQPGSCSTNTAAAWTSTSSATPPLPRLGDQKVPLQLIMAKTRHSPPVPSSATSSPETKPSPRSPACSGRPDAATEPRRPARADFPNGLW